MAHKIVGGSEGFLFWSSLSFYFHTNWCLRPELARWARLRREFLEGYPLREFIFRFGPRRTYFPERHLLGVRRGNVTTVAINYSLSSKERGRERSPRIASAYDADGVPTNSGAALPLTLLTLAHPPDGKVSLREGARCALLAHTTHVCGALLASEMQVM